MHEEDGGLNHQASPVKYMVVASWRGMKYYVIDTSFDGQGRIVARCDRQDDANTVCGALNRDQGYVYPL